MSPLQQAAWAEIAAARRAVRLWLVIAVILGLVVGRLTWLVGSCS